MGTEKTEFQEAYAKAHAAVQEYKAAMAARVGDEPELMKLAGTEDDVDVRPQIGPVGLIHADELLEHLIKAKDELTQKSDEVSRLDMTPEVRNAVIEIGEILNAMIGEVQRMSDAVSRHKVEKGDLEGNAGFDIEALKAEVKTNLEKELEDGVHRLGETGKKLDALSDSQPLRSVYQMLSSLLNNISFALKTLKMNISHKTSEWSKSASEATSGLKDRFFGPKTEGDKTQVDADKKAEQTGGGTPTPTPSGEEGGDGKGD